MRLIDADILVAKLRNHHDFFVNAWGGFTNLPVKDKARVDEITHCISEIINSLTVDAVEVVRCKDCMHRKDVNTCPMCFEETIEWEDDGYPEVDYVLHDQTTDDGFCPCGERREEE